MFHVCVEKVGNVGTAAAELEEGRMKRKLFIDAVVPTIYSINYITR